jgi:hypothetical protein
MTPEYRALVDKVEAFTQVVGKRRQRDLACRAGCDACCHAWLTLSRVEADNVRAHLLTLSAAERTAIAERGRLQQARELTGEHEPRCAMLGADGRCGVYEARPLVCRTQGHALRYPPGFVPESAVRSRVRDGEVTHCPLNYTEAAPASPDVLDAERVDQLLALVNHRHALALGVAPDTRTAISQLAAEADMLGWPESER